MREKGLFPSDVVSITRNMLTNVKVAFEGFIIKILYYKGLIIQEAYSFSVIEYCTDYRWSTDNPLACCNSSYN